MTQLMPLNAAGGQQYFLKEVWLVVTCLKGYPKDSEDHKRSLREAMQE